MRKHLFLFLFFVIPVYLVAQTPKVVLVKDKLHPQVKVSINGKHFTNFFFPDTIAKPVLYPIKAPNGIIITRGFPVTPIPGEPTDHPHHLGLWMNFGDVNGLDFWNNSFAIPENEKQKYGTIRFIKILEQKNGETGKLSYAANWNNPTGNTLLEETTALEFKEINGVWVIDRTTTLLAKTAVQFKDNKEGLLGLRMAHELQIPTIETKKFTDANGIETVIKATSDSIANGNYLNSNGLKGDAVWGKKANWCMAYGKIKSDSISVLILDHPYNENFPTPWHARGYGLFAANPMGSNVFNQKNPTYNKELKKGESITFKFRIAIAADKKILSNKTIQQLETDFSSSSKKLMFVGSYTWKGNPGIQVYQYDKASGKSNFVRSIKAPNASYMVVTPEQKYVYVLSEEDRIGSVASYAIDQLTGNLTLLNKQNILGDGPCYVSFHAPSKTVYTANYSSGSITVFKTNADGSLQPATQHILYSGSSINKTRQEKSHAHCAVVGPDNKYLYVSDLGTDIIHRHSILQDGSLSDKSVDFQVEPGNGPRHIVFNAKGTHAYSINEMKGSVDVFSVIQGNLKKVQTLVADTVQTKEDHGSGAIQLSPDGKWLLVSNRITSNQVVVFAVQQNRLLVKKHHVEVTKKPRFFRFDESGKFVLVAGQDSDKLQIFSFNTLDGRMKLQSTLDIPVPVSIEFIN
ncbi:MAG: beta-propeller fold lactonase family protein [Chitinophagaceae bacterium]